MKNFKQYLFVFGEWLIKKSGAKSQFIPEIDKDVLRKAVELSINANALQVSGEYKRHSVLSELAKSFPDQEKSVLSMAIELAIWGMR